MIDSERIASAYRLARRMLLNARAADVPWVGCLSSSALSTATAVSALTLVARERQLALGETKTSCTDDLLQRTRRGLEWLAAAQSSDGGWGDTDRSDSNVATTMLCLAAFRLAGSDHREPELLARGDAYLDAVGGIAALRERFGRDKTFAVPILANAALAQQLPWSEVAALPFELAALPQSLYRWLRLPVVSYAIPALVAIGQLRHWRLPSRNPLLRSIRHLTVGSSLRQLQRMQPASGGYLEAIPLTSFVVMSLTSTGRVAHPVVNRGVRFLCDTVSDDGSWPIDTNLATWNTSLALHALLPSSGYVGQMGNAAADVLSGKTECIPRLRELIDWLLDCQQTERHPFTGAAAGGWGWTDLSGAVPDADDTSGALLALRRAIDADAAADELLKQRVEDAADAGVAWLLQLQNRDGGWPTFCRGWGRLPFDRSGTDLTAHALRALRAWSTRAPKAVESASARGWRFLASTQQPDGSWLPLWFGNQDHPREENPWYGTAKVLLAFADAGKGQEPMANRGVEFLMATQLANGCWGGRGAKGDAAASGSLEETALCVEALARLSTTGDARKSLNRGIQGLVLAIESGHLNNASPIGFYFAKLWYYEQLYPLLFATSALRVVLESSE